MSEAWKGVADDSDSLPSGDSSGLWDHFALYAEAQNGLSEAQECIWIDQEGRVHGWPGEEVEKAGYSVMGDMVCDHFDCESLEDFTDARAQQNMHRAMWKLNARHSWEFPAPRRGPTTHDRRRLRARESRR